MNKHTLFRGLAMATLILAAPVYADIVLQSSMSNAYVDFSFSGTEDGGQAQPYNSLYEGIHVTEESGTLHLTTGETAATPLLDKPMTLVAEGGPVVIGVHEATPSITWPITGGTEPVGVLSSTFGCRQKHSENNRYDFHRGVDIPTPYGTNVRAIADGVIRIDGEHPSYSDMVIQITHEAEDGTIFYSNYIHLSASFVTVDQVVQRGDIIGQSGLGDSGFPHLHFETRWDGLNQRHCIHPLSLLPYADDRTAPALTIDDVDVSTPTNPQVTVTAAIPRVNFNDALDLISMTVTIGEDVGGGNINILDTHSYDMHEWNFEYTLSSPEPTNLYMDDEYFNGIHRQPEPFVTASDLYELTLTFTDLTGPANPANLVVTAVAKDLWGHTSEVVW